MYGDANTKNYAYHPPHVFHIETFALALHPIPEVLIKVFVRKLVKTTHPTWHYFAFSVMRNNAFLFHLFDFICHNRNSSCDLIC
jgi:hypothetical protein